MKKKTITKVLATVTAMSLMLIGCGGASTGGSESCLRAAQDALNGANNVGSCMSFRPTWNIDTSTLGSYIQIGDHIFF